MASSDRQIKVRIPEADYDLLSREASADDRSVAQYVRHLLVLHVVAAAGEQVGV